MELVMNGEAAAGYKSGAQRARVVSELWGAENLYCANCVSDEVERLINNSKAKDFRCPQCRAWYQLKSGQARIGKCINDGAYAAMMEAIRRDETPNFLFMQYDLATWTVRNLLLIPSFAFPSSAIVKRKPLRITAERHGWVGCTISLTNIPTEARIGIVREQIATPKAEVRRQYRKLKPLREMKSKERGWTLDVLNGIRELGRKEFTTEEAYGLAPKLEELHPDNRHVRDKIRQQLQVLRDAGLLIHVERGRWRIPDA